MTDLTSQLLSSIKSRPFPVIETTDGLISPDYEGGSILNLPDSICKLLGAPGIGGGALRPELLAPLGNNIQRVILVLMDALALHRLQRWMADGTAPVWENLADQGLLAPITSIIPCTTSAALTSLWTGRSPTEHGIPGYELWLKEYGVVASMIYHSPISFQNSVGSLSLAGFKPEEFLGQPTLGPHLAAHGVKTYALQHRSIIHSGLSQMFFNSVDAQGFNTVADLCVNLRRLVENRPRERQYIWVYSGEIDHFSHHYGPDDERTAAEFASFSYAFEKFFLNRLSPAARKGTRIILTADHGQITTRRNPHFEVRNHPGLSSRLHILPTGENRLMYLFIRPGQSEAVSEYFQQAWPGQFIFLDPAAAVEAGLFGPGRPHPRLMDRLGDLIVAGRQDAYLWWADKENFLIGRHGGLSEEEMIVPFLAAAP
jgi:hypothetical protein